MTRALSMFYCYRIFLQPFQSFSFCLSFTLFIFLFLMTLSSLWTVFYSQTAFLTAILLKTCCVYTHFNLQSMVMNLIFVFRLICTKPQFSQLSPSFQISFISSHERTFSSVNIIFLNNPFFDSFSQQYLHSFLLLFTVTFYLIETIFPIKEM